MNFVKVFLISFSTGALVGLIYLLYLFKPSEMKRMIHKIYEDLEKENNKNIKDSIEEMWMKVKISIDLDIDTSCELCAKEEIN